MFQGRTVHSLIIIMTTIAVYKDVEPTAFDFGGIKKENSVYFLKPSSKPFIQTPIVVAKEDLVIEETLAPKHQVVVSVPPRFAAWVKRIEESVVDYAIVNKSDLFKRELSSDFIATSFKPSIVAPTSWCVNVHPDVSVFDHNKVLGEQTDIKKDTRMSCIVTLHSVRFTRRNFYCKWLLRSARIQCPPEYCFLDRDDDTLSEDDESVGTLRPEEEDAPAVQATRDEINHDDECSSTSADEDDATCVDEIQAETEGAGDDQAEAEVEPEQQEVADALVASVTESADTADTAIPLGEDDESRDTSDATPSPEDPDAPKGDVSEPDAEIKEQVKDDAAPEQEYKDDAHAIEAEEVDGDDDEEAEVPTEILAVSHFVDDDDDITVPGAADAEAEAEAEAEVNDTEPETAAEAVTGTPVSESEAKGDESEKYDEPSESKEESASAEEAEGDAQESPVSVVIVVKDASRSSA